MWSVVLNCVLSRSVEVILTLFPIILDDTLLFLLTTAVFEKQPHCLFSFMFSFIFLKNDYSCSYPPLPCTTSIRLPYFLSFLFSLSWTSSSSLSLLFSFSFLFPFSFLFSFLFSFVFLFSFSFLFSFLISYSF